MRWIHRALAWARIVDSHDGMVSLTNCVLIVATVKLAMLANVTMEHLGALLIAMSAYAWKAQRRTKLLVTEERIAAAEAEVAKVAELAAETKRLSDKVVHFDNRLKGSGR